MKYIFEVGQRFGRLVVTGKSMNYKRHQSYICKCDCGRKTIVRVYHLVHGDTVSCGWHSAERLSTRLITHGDSQTKETLTYDYAI